MKTDIEKFMQEKQLDALFVTGAGRNNPAMVYLTGGIDVSQADLIKLAGQPPILFHSPIERDGAEQSGLSLRSYAEFPFSELILEANGNTTLAAAYRYRNMFASVGLSTGKVAVYGNTDLGRGHSLLSSLKRFYPGLDFEIKPQQDVIRSARAVKDPEEISRIRRMGEITVHIVAEIADFLSSHVVRGNELVKANGEPLTIADVKTRLRMLLVEQDVLSEGAIFAIGRDAGVPHNEGNPKSVLRLGETIIFDAFFQEAGGGYFYDFTRTWCLGYAPEKIQGLFEQVKMVHQKVAHSVQEGQSFHQYQQMACEMFEEMGHNTIMQNPATLDGYVHGLGHGVGLEIHELPSANADIPENILRPSMVITIEPGLYYPEQGYGIRIEDTYLIDPNGKAVVMAMYPWDLVLPIKGTV